MIFLTNCIQFVACVYFTMAHIFFEAAIIYSSDFFTLSPHLIKSRLINLLLTFATLVFISRAQSVSQQNSLYHYTEGKVAPWKPDTALEQIPATRRATSSLSFGFPHGNESGRMCVCYERDVCVYRTLGTTSCFSHLARMIVFT